MRAAGCSHCVSNEQNNSKANETKHVAVSILHYSIEVDGEHLIYLHWQLHDLPSYSLCLGWDYR